MPKQKNIDEKFTDLADSVSTKAGGWKVSAIALLFVISWLVLGPIMGFTNTWQLLINTPTTVIELFLGFLCLAASNRSQRAVVGLLNRLERAESFDKQELRKLIEIILEEHAIERKVDKL